MKRSILFILVLINCCVLAQQGTNLPFKYDSIVQISEKNQLLVYQKNKSGIYDLAQKKFLVPLEKGHIQFLENAKVFIKVNDNKFQILDDLGNLSNDTHEQLEFDFRQVYGANYFDGIDFFSETWLIVSQCKYPIQSDLPITDREGRDSIDVYGNYVYPPMSGGIQKSGVFDIKKRVWVIAPVYERITRIGNLILARSRIDKKGEYYFGSDHDFVDLYELKDGKIQLTKKIVLNKWDTDWSEILKNGLGVDHVEQQPRDPSWYKIHQSGKQKMVRFDNQYNLKLEDIFQNSWFDFINLHPHSNNFLGYRQQKLFHFYMDPENDSLIENPIEGNFVGISRPISSGFHAISDPHVYPEKSTAENENIENPIVWFGGYELLKQKPNRTNSLEFSLEILGNYIHVHHHIPEYREEFPLRDQYGEDSVYYSPQGEYLIAYPEPEKGFYGSGIFDIVSHKWLIDPQHFYIIPLHRKFVVQELDLNDRGLVQSSQIHQYLFNEKGALSKKIHSNEVKNRDALIKLIFDDLDIEFASMQDLPFEFLMDSNRTHSIIYKGLLNGKQILIQADFKDGIILSDVRVLHECTAEFVDATFDFEAPVESRMSHLLKLNNQYLDLKLSNVHLDNEFFHDSIRLVVSDFELTLYEFDELNKNFQDTVFFNLIRVVNRDKNLQSENYFSFSNTINSGRIEEISKEDFAQRLTKGAFKKHDFLKQGNLILVQKSPKTKEFTYEDFYSQDDLYTVVFHAFASGNSSVYRKTDKGRIALIPNFASLTSTAYGFLAMENFAIHNIQVINPFGEIGASFTDSINGLIKNKERGYRLLNSEFMEFSWKGQTSFYFIEEFEFGYRLVLDANNSILISPSGNIISEEHFEEYILDGDKIIGHNSEVLQLDEFGDFVLDENGNPIVLQKEKRQTFERKP